MFNHRTRFGWFLLMIVAHFIVVNSYPSSDTGRTQCNFYTIDCNWTMPNNNESWYWQQNSKSYGSLSLNSPPYSFGGGYVLELLPGFDDSFLKSPVFDFPNQTSFCFQFEYYYLSNTDTPDNSFELYLTMVDSSENFGLLWRTHNVYGDFWHQAKVTIISYGQFQMKFVVKGHHGLVAVRDFRLKLESCPKNDNTCDFETDDCEWQSGNAFQRTLAKNQNSIDHTYSSPYGHFLSLNGSFDQSLVKLRSPSVRGLNVQCFGFWSWISIGQIDRINLTLHQSFSENGTSTPIWIWKPLLSTHQQWIHHQVTVDMSSLSFLEFRAQAQAEGNEIRFDDFSLKPYSCPPPVTCSFDNTICGYQNDVNEANFDWLAGTGRVENVSKLNWINQTGHVHFYASEPVLYTDFTTLKLGKQGKMRFLSDITYSVAGQDICIFLHYTIWSFQKDRDFFGLYAETLGQAKAVQLVWNLTSYTIGKRTVEPIFIPYEKLTPNDFRLILQTTTDNPSTYIIVHYLSFSRSFEKCGDHTETPTTLKPTTPVPTVEPKEMLNCDFENGNLCNWISYSGPFFLAQANQTKFGIFADHTRKNSLGHFAAFDARYRSIGLLKAKNPFPLNTKICFSFYYWFYSNIGVGSKMQFYLNQTTNNGAPAKQRPLFHSFDANMLEWRLAMIELLLDEEFSEFVFKINMYLPNYGIFGIDDIKVVEEKCQDLTQNRDFCDFEMNSTCMFEPVNDFWGIWTIMLAKQLSTKNNSMVDHTTHTNDGHLYGLVIDPSVTTLEPFFIETKTYFSSQTFCLKFSFYLTDNVTLSYSIRDVQNDIFERKLWTVSGTTNHFWFTHQTPVYPSELMAIGFRLRFSIQLTNGSVRTEDVFAAIDDVTFSEGYCRLSTFCDFDKGDICTLETVYPNGRILSYDEALFLARSANYSFVSSEFLTGYSNTYWQVYSPQQQDPNFIDHDHTWRNEYGKFLLSHHPSRGARSIIITERYSLENRPHRSLCLYLSLYSDDEDYIVEVYQGESTFNGFGMKIWNLNQSIVEDWKSFEIQATAVNQSSLDIYFFIVSTSVKIYTYVALDDVGVKDHCTNPSNLITSTTSVNSSPFTTEVPPDSFDCGHNQWIPMEKVCDYKFDCNTKQDEMYCGDCDFVDHFACYYRLLSIDDREGQFRFRFSDVAPYGPKDYYLKSSITASSNENVDYEGRAWAISQPIHQAYLGCDFSFSYKFFTPSTPANQTSLFDLFIYFKDLQIRTKLWQSNANELSLDDWNSILIQLNRVRHVFQLEFVAQPLQSVTGDYHSLASITKTYCQPPEPVDSEADCSGKFFCHNKVCILNEYVCDFDDDCGDGSDEKHCDETLKFSFEDGLRGWGEAYTDPHKCGWHLQKSKPRDDLRLAPTFDHTADFLGGTYLFMDTKTSNNIDCKNHAIIDSPLFRITEQGCNVRLYKMRNSINSTFNIHLWNYRTSEVTTLYTDSYHSLTFVPWVVHLDPSDDPHKILLEGILKPSADNFVDPYIAIDDIVFSTGCQWIHDHHYDNVSTPKPCDGIECLNQNSTKICLPLRYVCDFIQQCKYGEDESKCGNCTFNNRNTCGWINSPYDEDVSAKWQQYQPARGAPDPLPKVDGSNSSIGGYYATYSHIAVYASNKIISPRINRNTAPRCTIQFDVLSLRQANIAVLVNDRRRIHISTILHTEWTKFRTEIGEQPAPFQIFIDAYPVLPEVVSRRQFLVAIDNIEMLGCDPFDPNNHDVNPIKLEDLNCDFEQDLCGWIVPNSSYASTWFRTNLIKNEPGNDHTSLILPKPEHYGVWLSTQTKHTAGNNILRSAGPLKPDPQSTYCLTFWYYYFGSAKTTFKVFLQDTVSKENTTIWIRTTPDFRYWKQASIEYNRTSAYYIYLEAEFSFQTILGIDDVKMYNTSCPVFNYEYCDFETNLCDMTTTSNHDQISRQRGDFVDHTTGTKYGYYLSDRTVPDKVFLYKDLKNLPVFINNHSIHDFCFNLYYYFGSPPNSQDHSSIIQVGVKRLNFIKHLMYVNIGEEAQEKSLNTWSLMSFNFQGAMEDILFISLERDHLETEVAIDDLTIKSSPCMADGSCDFEYDMCGWHNKLNDSDGTKESILWVRVQPINRIVRKHGLPLDHTLKTMYGNYLALSLDLQDLINNEVVLDGPILIRKNQSTICLRLFYFAQALESDEPVEAMRIRLVDLKDSSKMDQEYRINATADLDWRKFQAEFKNVPKVYLLRITSMYRSKIMTDIGLDDIQVIPGACPHDDGTPTPFPPTATPLPDREKVADCNFESNCKWSYRSDSWNVTSFVEGCNRNIYIPEEDHTYRSKFGHYLMFTYQQDGYELKSPEFKYDKPRCLSLWYYNDGEDPFYLSFYESTRNDSYIKLVGRFGSTMETRLWQLIRINLPHHPDWDDGDGEIRIQILLRPSTRKLFSVFAIDDIQVRPGQCPHSHDYTYTFTGGLEDLQVSQLQPLTEPLISKIFTGDIGERVGAPSFDHTTYTSKGSYFIFMNQKNPQYYYSYFVDILEMLHLPPESNPVCVRFAHQSKGNFTAAVYALPLKEAEIDWRFMQPLWKLEFPKSFWTIEEFNILVDYEYKLRFDLEKYGHDLKSFVAIDDLTILQHACTLPVDCDFDRHYCSYTYYQDGGTNYHWEVFNTPAIDLDWPGPKYDHTAQGNGGGYLFLTAFRSGQHTNMLSAKIVSGARHVPFSRKSCCLTMWSVISSNQSKLNVTILRYGPQWTDQNRSTEALVLENVIQQEWTQLMFELNATTLVDTHEVQIIIHGQLDPDPMASIAIDDIDLFMGPCDTNGMVCENGVHIGQEKICNFVKDCPSGLDEMNCGNCNFETDSCGWETKVLEGYHRWERVQVNDSVWLNERSPKFDADGRKDGHFLLMRPGGPIVQQQGGHAEFALHFDDPVLYLKHSYKTCTIEFDFYIDTVGEYFLKISSSRMINILNTFYTVSHESMGGWMHAMAIVGGDSSAFFIDFDAYQQDLAAGVMAIDNIYFKHCSLPDPLPKNQTECPNSMILCNVTRICIQEDAICDNVNDCGNDEDESDCFGYDICSFNDLGSCGLTVPYLENSNVYWALSSGDQHYDDGQLGYEPLIDNTFRTRYGMYFLLAPKHDPRETVGYAEFYTPFLKTATSYDACVFRFFFYMHADPDKIAREKIEIYVRSVSDDGTPPRMVLIFTIGGNYYESQRWNKRIVKEKSVRPFQFVIRGYLNDNRTRMAIDDLSYGTGCIKHIQPFTTVGTSSTTTTPKPHTTTHRAGSTVAVVMIPIFLVLGIVGGYYGHRRYRSAILSRGTLMAFSMKSLDQTPLQPE